jgi:hypothetical protein
MDGAVAKTISTVLERLGKIWQFVCNLSLSSPVEMDAFQACMLDFLNSRRIVEAYLFSVD